MSGGRQGGNRAGGPLAGEKGEGLKMTNRLGRDVMESCGVSAGGSGRIESWHDSSATVKGYRQLLQAVRLRGQRGEVGEEPVRICPYGVHSMDSHPLEAAGPYFNPAGQRDSRHTHSER